MMHQMYCWNIIALTTKREHCKKAHNRHKANEYQLWSATSAITVTTIGCIVWRNRWRIPIEIISLVSTINLRGGKLMLKSHNSTQTDFQILTSFINYTLHKICKCKLIQSLYHFSQIHFWKINNNFSVLCGNGNADNVQIKVSWVFFILSVIISWTVVHIVFAFFQHIFRFGRLKAVSFISFTASVTFQTIRWRHDIYAYDGCCWCFFASLFY